MEADGRNMDEYIISSTSGATTMTTTMMTEVIHELVNNDEETRDEGRVSEEVGVTQPIELPTMTISLESMNNAAPEGRTLKYHKGECNNRATNFCNYKG